MLHVELARLHERHVHHAHHPLAPSGVRGSNGARARGRGTGNTRQRLQRSLHLQLTHQAVGGVTVANCRSQRRHATQRPAATACPGRALRPHLQVAGGRRTRHEDPAHPHARRHAAAAARGRRQNETQGARRHARLVDVHVQHRRTA